VTIFLVRKRCVMDTKAVWSIAELHICNFTIIFSEIYKFRNRGYSILKVKQQKNDYNFTTNKFLVYKLYLLWTLNRYFRPLFFVFSSSPLSLYFIMCILHKKIIII